MKGVQQFTIELNGPHGQPHWLSAHVDNHWTVNYEIHVYDTNFLEAILKIKNVSRLHSRYYSEVYEAYFRFSVGCELAEHYVPADVVYLNHLFIINNLEFN